jgi:hypothetical protein
MKLLPPPLHYNKFSTIASGVNKLVMMDVANMKMFSKFWPLPLKQVLLSITSQANEESKFLLKNLIHETNLFWL